MFTALPKSSEAQVLGKQVLRSETSVGANYREALRARSKSEYVAKMNVSLMELEETAYWLEMLERAEIVRAARLADLRQETNELTAIFVTLIRRNKPKK
jgi:four helix bundle protein